MAPRTQLADLAESERELARPADAPANAQLMKAVMCREPFSDPAWIYERKLDGIRCLAIRDGWTGSPAVAQRHICPEQPLHRIRRRAGAQASTRFAVDGEVVAFDGAQTSFARLAERGPTPMSRSSSTCSTCCGSTAMTSAACRC